MIKIECYAVMTKLKQSVDKKSMWTLVGEGDGPRYFKTRAEAKEYCNEVKNSHTKEIEAGRMFRVCSLSRTDKPLTETKNEQYQN